jgi:hypothetical protein
LFYFCLCIFREIMRSDSFVLEKICEEIIAILRKVSFVIGYNSISTDAITI